MVRAWYMDSSEENPQLPHMTEPPQFLDLEMLKKKTGCEYFKLDPNDTETLEQIKKDRGYSYQDQREIRRETMQNYEEQIKQFFTEHIHSDEEIRMCAEGSAYFDARDIDDRWVRIEFVKGDLLILPAGIYHRFILDQSNYVKVFRFFSDVPVWTPINRPADEHPARQSYVETYCRKG